MNDRNNWREKPIPDRHLTWCSWTITMDNFMRLDSKWINKKKKNIYSYNK